jgi:ribosomal protein S18 acetylase RimI-like enzyme
MIRISEYDAPAVADLEIELFPGNCFNERTLREEIKVGFGCVVYRGGDLAGYLLARTTKTMMDILRIGVRRPYQHRGIGTEMLLHALKEGAGAGMSVMLCVRKDNRGALRLYQRHGFEITGRLEDSWVMLHLD